MTSPLDALTTQQRRTLRVLRDCGWLYKLAAVDLDVSEIAVRTSVHRMLKRSGLPDRAELAYWLAVEHVHAGGPVDIRSKANTRSVST